MAQGRKTGGRRQGSTNKATSSLKEAVMDEVDAPLPVLLARIGVRAMEAGDLALAVNAFSRAAAFIYPRLAPVQEATSAPLPPFQIIHPDGTVEPQTIHITREIITKRK